MASIARHDITKKRKNFLPALLATVLFWLILGGIIYFVDPFSFGAVPIFLVLFFLAILFTFSLLTASSRRGFLAASALTIFLILRYLGIGHLLNFLLLVGLVITIELYFWRK